MHRVMSGKDRPLTYDQGYGWNIAKSLAEVGQFEEKSLIDGCADSNTSSILHVADGVVVLTMMCLMEQAGATITVGTWPRALKVFKQNLEAGKFDESMKLSGGRKMKIRGM